MLLVTCSHEEGIGMNFSGWEINVNLKFSGLDIFQWPSRAIAAAVSITMFPLFSSSSVKVDEHACSLASLVGR